MWHLIFVFMDWLISDLRFYGQFDWLIVFDCYYYGWSTELIGAGWKLFHMSSFNNFSSSILNFVSVKLVQFIIFGEPLDSFFCENSSLLYGALICKFVLSGLTNLSLWPVLCCMVGRYYWCSAFCSLLYLIGQINHVLEWVEIRLLPQYFLSANSPINKFDWCFQHPYCSHSVLWKQT